MKQKETAVKDELDIVSDGYGAEGAGDIPVFAPPKKKRKWPKRVAILLIIVGVIAFIMSRLSNAGSQFLSSIYLNEAAAVRDMTIRVSSTGTVEPIESYNVSSLINNCEVIEAPFEEGDWVEKGDLLYRFDAEDAEDAVNRAQLSLSQAQLSYNATYESVSPIATGDGIVQKLYVKVGESVSAGTVLAEISDTATMLIDIPFHSVDAQSLFAGQAATVTLEGNMETLPATIVSVSGADEVGAGNALLRTVRFEVANPGALNSGASATAMVGGVSCAASGTFEQRAVHNIVAQTGGEITALHVAEGDSVIYGQTLLSIGGTAAKNSLENARISVQNAQLALDSAVRALDNYVITAPISGTIIQKNFKMGDNLETSNLNAANGILAVIFDMSTLTFEMRIDELDINRIAIGQSVSITADGVEGASFDGIVDKININGTTAGGSTTYPITVKILEAGGLKPGMNVSADVLIEEVGEVLCVPVDAVKRSSGTPIVMVVPASAISEEGILTDLSVIEDRPVTLGRNDDQYIEITAGIDEGEIVVWENQGSDFFVGMTGG